MIVRRFAQSLRDQNWTTITIEFVLLVAGVFLGIQAANWNATQQERVLEAEFISRLQRDFRAINERLDHNVSRWRAKSEAPLRLLADLDAFRLVDTWPRAKAEIVGDLEETLDGRIPAPRAATYVELLSAGKLGLIRDRRLRDALLDYDVQTGFTMTAYEGLKQRTDPHMAPIVAHVEINPRLVDPEVVAQTVRTGDIDVFVDVDLARLAADPDVETALKMHARASSNHLLVALRQQQAARAVTALLEPGAGKTGDTP